MFAGLGGQSGGSSSGSNPTSTVPASSIFSQPLSAAPSSGNIFANSLGTAPASGSFSNSSTSAPAPGNIFSKPPPTASTSGNIFSRPTAATSEAGSVFNQPNTVAPPGASIFGPAPSLSGSTLPGSSQGAPPQTQPSHSTSGPGYFQSLLEKNKKRARKASLSSSSRLENVSALQLGLGDISKRVRQLGGEGQRRKDGAEETRA